jgi:hypothetical protein
MVSFAQSTAWPKRRTGRAAALCAASLVLASWAACSADPPPVRSGSAPPLGSDRYANIATCTPVGDEEECPGDGCGDNAQGPPDGVSVWLARCGTLDAVFTAGNIRSLAGRADLAIVINATEIGDPDDVGGSVRIEASGDGVDFTIVGFIGSAPDPTIPTSCRAELVLDGSDCATAGSDPTRPCFLVDFADCNTVSNVSFVRISEQRAGEQSVRIDAIRALPDSFCPHDRDASDGEDNDCF